MARDIAYTPDLWGGEGIVRKDAPDQAANLAQAAREMRDTGSDTLMDAIADATPEPRGPWHPAETDESRRVFAIHQLSSIRDKKETPDHGTR